MTTVTKTDLAALMGVSPSHLSRLVRQGMPGPVQHGGGRGHAARYDAVACLAWQRAQLAADAAPSSPRDRYLDALRQRAELELEERRGQLVAIADVREEFADLATAAKTRLRAIPSRIAPQVTTAAGRGAAVVQHMIRSAIDDALLELSRGAYTTNDKEHAR